MGNVTSIYDKTTEMGRRLRECRKLRRLSQNGLVALVEALPENGGKVRSPKQIGYMEHGFRPISAEYALLLAKVLGVDSRYLLLQSPFKNKEEELSDAMEKLITGEYRSLRDEAKRALCIRSLAECLGYEITGDHMRFHAETGCFDDTCEAGSLFHVVAPDGKAIDITYHEIQQMFYNIAFGVSCELKKQFDPGWNALRQGD